MNTLSKPDRLSDVCSASPSACACCSACAALELISVGCSLAPKGEEARRFLAGTSERFVHGFLPGGESTGAAGATLLDGTELVATTSVARRRVPKGPTLVVSTGAALAALIAKMRLPCECGGGAAVGAEVGAAAGAAEDTHLA
eukprot:scaffold69127_cov36-Phaeocystis_antarctica.AAC.2